MTQPLARTLPPTVVGTVSAYYAGRDVEAVRRLRAEVGRVTLQGAGGLRVLAALERAGDLHDVDLDPAGYLGPSDDDNALLPLEWEARQRDLGLTTVRSRGHYVRSSDSVALAAAVGCSLPPEATRLISLNAGWLRTAVQAELRSALLACDGPLALVFADPFDPFGGQDAIANLRDLLYLLRSSGAPVELLRCDLVGLGFVTEGGAQAAVGVTTATRHHGLPLGKREGAKYEERQTSPLVFIPQLASWHRGTWLSALAPFHGAGLTDCSCIACDGQSLMRFAAVYPGRVPTVVAQHGHASVASGPTRRRVGNSRTHCAADEADAGLDVQDRCDPAAFADRLGAAARLTNRLVSRPAHAARRRRRSLVAATRGW